MANGALNIALGQRRSPTSRPLIKRLQNVLALQARFLFAIEDDDIAMHHSLQAELVFDESKIGIELAKHIGEFTIVIEADFNPIQGLCRLRLRAGSPSLITRACVHTAPMGRCL